MKWLRRRPPIEVPLDPAQVLALQFLFRYKAAPERKLWQEVAQSLPMLSEREFAQGLADLADRHVIEPRFQPESGSTWFVVGELGKKLKGKLPPNLRSAIVIYV